MLALSCAERFIVFLGLQPRALVASSAFSLPFKGSGTQRCPCFCSDVKLQVLVAFLIGSASSSLWKYNCANGLAGECLEVCSLIYWAGV